MATAIIVIPGAQALSVSEPKISPDHRGAAVTIEFDDPDLVSLSRLVLHFDCSESGSFSESIGLLVGSTSPHATLVDVTDAAHTGYGYQRAGQTGYGYSAGQHGAATDSYGLPVDLPNGYGYFSNLDEAGEGYGYNTGNGGYGYGYGTGYGYGYDSGFLTFVFAWTQAAFLVDEDCTLVVEVVPQGEPSGDFEGPRSASFVPRARPVADAGQPLAVLLGQPDVELDGSFSYDPNGDDLSYHWEQVEGTPVTLEQDPASPIATFDAPLEPQTLVFRLTVNDTLDDDSDLTSVQAKIVVAPVLGTLLEGVDVELAAAASLSQGATVQWSVRAGPPLDLSDERALHTSFTTPEVDVDTLVTLRITVQDGESTDFDESVFAVFDNEAPIADAGADATQAVGLPFELDGRDSYDPDGDGLSFHWQILGQATGASLLGAHAPAPILTATAPGPVTLQLTVTEVIDDSIETGDLPARQNVDFVTVFFDVAPPLRADAGPDQTVLQGATVTLRGDGSTGAITYDWTDRAGVRLPTSLPASPNATFVAGAVGTFEFNLTVTGAAAGTARDSVNVTVLDPSASNQPQTWYLHTTDCTLVDAQPPVPPILPLLSSSNSASTTPQANDGCARIATPLAGDSVDYPAAATRPVAQGVLVEGELRVSASVLAADVLVPVAPVTNDVPVTVTLLKGGAAIGTTQVLIPAQTVGAVLGTPVTLDYAITTQAALAPGDAFSLRVAVQPSFAVLYLIDVDGADGSQFTFPGFGAAPGAPTVAAPANRVADEGSTVTLTATGSDPDGGPVAFRWFQVGGPAVTLVGANTATVSFTAPQVPNDATSIRLRVLATDDEGLTSLADGVRIGLNDTSDANRPPVANAGRDFQALEGSTVLLPGTASDADGDFLVSRWTQEPGQALVGGAANRHPTDPQRSFKAPDVSVDTVFTFVLTTRDNSGAVSIDTMQLTVRPTGSVITVPPPPTVVVQDPATPPTTPTPTQPESPQSQPSTPTTPTGEKDTDGDGIPDRIEVLLGTNPNSAGDKPSFDISTTLGVQRVGGANLLTWPRLPVAAGFQVWSSNSPYVLLATVDADQTAYEDPAGKTTTKYKLTYFVDETAAGGYLADASGLASLPGWDETTNTTFAANAVPPSGGSGDGGRDGLAGWIVFLLIVIPGTLLILLVAGALRERRKA